MLAALQTGFVGLLQVAFPSLFGGGTPPVKVDFPAYEWGFDESSTDPTAGEPTQDDAADVLAFDAAHPAGPYSLSRPPYPGPRRVYLLSADGDRQALGPGEVQWDALNPQSFTLSPKPARLTTGFTQVQVLYGVTAVFTQLKSKHPMPLLLTATDAAAADQAEALLLAFFTLNRLQVMQKGSFSLSDGGYQVVGTIKSLKLQKGTVAAPQTRSLVLDAEVELKISRALAETEGRPIAHILSPGRSAGARLVDVNIDVES